MNERQRQKQRIEKGSEGGTKLKYNNRNREIGTDRQSGTGIDRRTDRQTDGNSDKSHDRCREKYRNIRQLREKRLTDRQEKKELARNKN